MREKNFGNVGAIKKNTNVMVTSAVLMGLGVILRLLMPSAGIKPDLMLATMFAAITLKPTIKHALGVGVVCGILTSMTTGFPGGQIPLFIDKITTSIAFVLAYSFLKENLKEIKLYQYSALYFIFTMLSGIIFVYSAMYFGRLMGLAENMALFSKGTKIMITGVVMPTALCNAFFGIIITKALKMFVD